MTRYILKCIVVALCFFYLVPFAKAQIDVHNLKFLSINDEVSKKPISAILQDNQGYVWIGTRGSGLYRYDGVNLESFKQVWGDSTSINSNQIYTLYLDSKNNLWIGTDAGLSLFSREQEKFLNFKSLSENTGGYFTITSIIEDHRGNLIIGTQAHGVFKFDNTNYTNSKIKVSRKLEGESIFINDIAIGLDGICYFGTSIGLLKYDSDRKVLERYEVTKNNEEYAEILKRSIESLYIDGLGTLWIGTWKDGVIQLEVNEEVSIDRHRVTSEKIFSITSFDGKILLGTENDGLYVINNEGVVLHHYSENISNHNSIKSSSIWSVFVDNKNRIWLGYYNRGVDLYNPLQSKFGTIDELVNKSSVEQSSPITDIIEDNQGGLKISTFNTVFSYDPNTKNLSDLSLDNEVNSIFKPDIGIESLFVDSNDNFWIGTWDNGLYFREKGTNKFVNFSKESTRGALQTNTIRGFAEDSKGRVWMASFLSGLHYYDLELKLFTHCTDTSFDLTGLSNSDVKTILIDSYDNIWVGSTNGLYKIKDLGNSNFQAESMKTKMELVLENHPSLHNILSLYETQDGAIWIGTDGMGLLRYDHNDDKFYSQNLIHNIEERTVNGIINDTQNNLWICGDLGVTKLNLETKEITNFTTSDGLLSHYFRNGVVAQASSGDLYFGNQLGVNYINPSDYKINQNEPILHLTDFKLFNKSVKLFDKNSVLKKSISETDTLELKYNQNFFSIDFVGINYTRTEKNEYAYVLEGFDKKWNYVGSNKRATYTSLNPGDYIFKLKAANNDGVWTQKPLQLYIRVTPAWWESKLAYIFYLFSAILLGSILYVFSRKRFKEKQSVFLERNRRLQEEELHRVKLKFFTNISHEFRTPLTLIINPINDLLNEEYKNLPKKVTQKLKTIHKNSFRLSLLINELMDFRKLQSNKLQVLPERVDIVYLLKNIKSFFEEEKRKRNISLTLQTQLVELEAFVDSSMFEKIMFNILSNAFKVTPDGGSINIVLEKKEGASSLEPNKNLGCFVVSVQDSGSGIDQKEYNKIFKRFYQVSTNNKNYYGSTGIGLEMVKEYIHLHKGKIEVNSKIGKGAKFIMTFPILEPHSSRYREISADKYGLEASIIRNLNNETQVNTMISTTAGVTKNKEYSVLIVEDNLELQEYIENELSHTYRTFVASNGKLGYETAIENQPDIIITDVVMPLLDGIELCKSIKTNIATSHIPIIILTSKAMVEDKIKGVDSGADGYLSKPFDINLLKSIINRTISNRKLLLDKYTIQKDPEVKITSTLTTLDDVFLKRVVNLINSNIDDQTLNVENLADHLRLSRSQLYRKIKILTGLSASEFLRKVRLEKARDLLQSQYNYNISEVTYKVGFSSPSYFTKCFKKEFGYLPTEEDIQINKPSND